MTTIGTMRALDKKRGAVRNSMTPTSAAYGRRVRRQSGWHAGSPKSRAICGSAAWSR